MNNDILCERLRRPEHLGLVTTSVYKSPETKTGRVRAGQLSSSLFDAQVDRVPVQNPREIIYVECGDRLSSLRASILKQTLPLPRLCLALDSLYGRYVM